MAKFRLLKDLPDLKAGALFTLDKESNCYKCEKQIWVAPFQYHRFTIGTVAGTTDWFEKVEEPIVPKEKRLYTVIDMVDFGRFVRDMINPVVNKPIDMIMLDKWIQYAHPEECVKPKE